MEMIDIHSHILYGVDDGAKDLEESIAMIKDAKAQGIHAIIATPHYRYGMFAYPKEKIEKHYSLLREQAEAFGVELYLGTEQHVNSQTMEYVESGRCHTLADSSYVLMEYKCEADFSYIKETVQEAIRHGLIPIVAHIERYRCLTKIENVSFLREIGAMIQVNADAVIGKEGFRTKAYVKKLLKNYMVDFVASDAHGINSRKNHMGKCQIYLYKKYDNRYVEKILEKNARKILETERV